jgi:cytochrome c5
MARVLTSAVAIVLAMTGGEALAAEGHEIYVKNCAICHNNLPPKLGDKVAWGPLIKQGEDALVTAVIKGKWQMPPRAGKPGLSDSDIKAAVEYIETKVQ